MAAIRQVVALNDKEIRDCLIDRAKLAINGKENGPQIQGSATVKFVPHANGEGDYSAEVIFERPGK